MQLSGLMLTLPEELPPSGGFTTPTHLVSVFSEDDGEVFKLIASDEAVAVLATASSTPCPVVLDLRARALSLAEVTNGARKGRAYKLRILRASFPAATKRSE